MIARRDAQEATCHRFDAPLKAAALQFCARHPAFVAVVLGAKQPTNTAENGTLLALNTPRKHRRHGLLPVVEWPFERSRSLVLPGSSIEG